MPSPSVVAVEAASAEIEVQRVRNELETSRRRLAATWGSDRPLFASVRGDLEEVEDLPSFDPLLGRATQGPEIARWATEIEMLEAAVAMEKSLGIPDLELGAGVRRELETSLDTYILSVGLALPVLDRNQGSIREAECNLARAKEDRRAAEVGVLSELGEAYQSLAASHMEATSLAATVLPAAERAFEATGEGYRQGKFGYLDVLDSQRTLFDVRAQYIDALEAYHRAVADLERLVGSDLFEEMQEETGGGR